VFFLKNSKSNNDGKQLETNTKDTNELLNDIVNVKNELEGLRQAIKCAKSNSIKPSMMNGDDSIGEPNSQHVMIRRLSDQLEIVI